MALASRKELIKKCLRGMGLDALVASSFPSVSHLAHTNITTQKLIPDRLALVVWPKESDPTLIVCSIEEELVQRESTIRDIRTYIEHTESPMQLLAGLFQEQGLNTATIGIEETVLSARYYKELVSLIPKARFVACDRELARMRMIKDDAAIKVMKEAAIKTDTAIAASFSAAKPGMSERDIAQLLRSSIYGSGASEVSHLLLSAGENTQNIHHLPADNTLQPGDLLRVDAGGKFGNYYSDLARTVVIGKPSVDQLNNYRLVWDSVQTIIDAVRPGIQAKDLYSIYEARFRQRGQFLPRLNPHVGHGLGIELHEQPLLEPQNTEILQPGMVLAIEIAHPDKKRHLCHSEDLVFVTEKGHDILSRSRDWQELLAV